MEKIRKFLSKMYCVIVCTILSVMLFSGCGDNVSVLKNGTMEESSQTEEGNDTQNQDKNQDTQEVQDSEGAELSKDEDSHKDELKDTEDLIYVDLGGAVNNPGVYSLPEGSRVFEVVALAGGFTKDAYVKIINQAKILEDGEQIYVYTVEEAEELLSQGVSLGTDASADSGDSVKEGTSGGKVNLNLADKEVLMTLTGIGSTRADAILQYRKEHGKFSRIEELMQVEGIKEKTYEKIKDCITVS